MHFQTNQLVHYVTQLRLVACERIASICCELGPRFLGLSYETYTPSEWVNNQNLSYATHMLATSTHDRQSYNSWPSSGKNTDVASELEETGTEALNF